MLQIDRKRTPSLDAGVTVKPASSVVDMYTTIQANKVASSCRKSKPLYFVINID